MVGILEKIEMAKTKMPHKGHKLHMCFLANLGCHLLNADGYKSLVNKPKYVCKACGRVANKAMNLCSPTKL